ncbi:MAG: lysophospholipid acyltransferase family protein [Kiloniellales bacterium]|jgi:1-acyl-sn-glycerol-3-phosphate acyltransferase
MDRDDSATVSFGSPLRATGRILLYFGFTLCLMPVQAVALLLGLPLARRLPLWYHRRCCPILGLKVECRGQQSQVRPTLFACNHVSYLDITVLGSLIEGSFVAKAEVARWPLFGWLARLQRTVFVDRRSLKTADQRDIMKGRLEAGDDLILFPEGTSGDGNRVLPFKSALFSVAESRPGGKPLLVQPVSIAYARLDDSPMGRYLRPFFAWYGDMDLVSHIWEAMGLGWVTVVVEFHPAVTIEGLGSRKALSDYCYGRVAAGMAAALTGRPQTAPEPAVALATA